MIAPARTHALLCASLFASTVAACGGEAGDKNGGSGGGGNSAGSSGNSGSSGSSGSSGNSGSAGSSGSSGASGASGSGGGMQVPGKAGVVRGEGDARMCYALCSAGTTPSNGETDWGFESGASCIIPGTITAAGQACTTGEPLPPVDMTPRPGVVLGEGDARTCFPLCEVATAGTVDHPDWNFENGTSCVVPGTHTAVAQTCTTNQPLPDPAALCGRMGVVTLDSGGTNMRQCSALCTDPSVPTTPDDWDFEYGDSCVIPNSPTSKNQTCNTCMDVPAPVPRPGVVVTEGAKPAECIALCTVTTDPATDPDGDGWSYEDNASCVIPGTATAVTNLACTTGMPIPPDVPRPGVEVRDGVDGPLTCAATCTFYLSKTQDGANDDGFADDWAWEHSAPCIIPGTGTAANTPCMTLTEPLPAPEPRPGIYVNSDLVEDSCKTTACVPLCRVVTTPSDPAYPDWSWEDNNACVLPGSTQATIVPKSKENQGYDVPPRKCTWGAPLPDFLKPPALDAAKTKQAYFKTSGAKVLDPYGNEFVARGVNNSHAWYDICGQYSAFVALDSIAAAGANAVRVGWAFQTIDPGGPTDDKPQKNVIGTHANLLAEILYRVVELKMVPILAINDTTGQTKTGEAQRMAHLMVDSAEYKAVLKAYEPYLLLGIANEYNIPAASYNAEYNAAVKILRDAGLNHPLVITGNDWGQGCDSLLGGAAIVSADPLKNIVFDAHIYTYLTYDGSHGGTAAMVQGCMDDMLAANLPLLVGEFGNTHSSGAVEWATIMKRGDANRQGYTPWLWYGDTEYPELNMNAKWDGPLSEWGKDTAPFNTAHGNLTLVAAKASIFP